VAQAAIALFGQQMAAVAARLLSYVYLDLE
jgi:hypothetical protein